MAKTPDKVKVDPKPEAKGTTIPDTAIQLVGAHVAMGSGTVVVRDWTRPLTYPEALLLEHMHQQPGKAEAIRKVEHVGYVTRSGRAEKARLVEKYGSKIVETVFPGANPQMERFNPENAPTPGLKCLAGEFVSADEPEDDGTE